MTSKTKRAATQLAEDAVSLTRVRNRFSKATDEQLPKIMTGLLPKLLQRLEDYSGTTNKQLDGLCVQAGGVTPLGPSTLSQLQKIQQDIFGIFATALERIRGNSAMSTDTLTRALLPFTSSKNSLVGTWTLAFLQSAISRTTAQSMDSSMVAILMKALGDHHASLLALTDAAETSLDQGISDSAIKALESRWIRVSWLLMDCIMILSGYKPLIDWDADHFDPKQSSRDDSASTGFYEKAREEAAKVISCHGGAPAVSVTSLLLDLILFWPDESSLEISALSPLANKRMNHRSKTTPPLSVDDDTTRQSALFQRQRQRREIHPGLPMRFQFQDRVRGPDTSWSDMTKLYLRHVKLAFLKFAIWPPNKGLFGNQDEDSAVVLSISAANFNSMHGKVALDYLNRRDTKKQPVSIPVAISAMILILGEEASREILQRFQSIHGRGCWQDVLGSLSSTLELRRPALPPEVSNLVGGYLIKNEIHWSGARLMLGSNNDTTYASLAVELCLGIYQLEDTESKVLSMRLVGRLCKNLPKLHEDTCLKMSEVVVEILGRLVDSGLADLNEMRAAISREGIWPLGVPAPSDHRNDLDRLLSSHRQSLKRKNLKRDDEVDARREAYHLVTLMPSSVFERTGDEPFKFPNLLLQCAVYEDIDLQYFVIKAVDSVLTIYVEKIMGQKSVNDDIAVALHHQATLLLPSLLETTCSENACVRRIGMEWIKRLLVHMDPEAAVYLASHLVNDDDSAIARTAQEVVSTSASVIRDDIAVVPNVTFYDLGDAEQALTLRRMLEERIEELSRSLGISSQNCEKLLLQHEFSVSKAVSAIDDIEGMLKECGLDFNIPEKAVVDATICGICYDEIEATNKYSLRCGHEFCTFCWISYVTEASESKFSLLDMRCPQHDCWVSLLRSDIQAISPAFLFKWDQYLLQSFVELDPFFRYCPGADCRCVAAVNQLVSSLPKSVTCGSCCSPFCFACGERPHHPATCEDYSSWKRLKESSRLWLKHHSKPCPGCQAPIEKNGGCNHVHCSSCQADFCWLCLGLLNTNLASHNCNRYDPIESAEDDFERRALFTATRFEAHDHAEDFAYEQLRRFQPSKLLEAFWFLEEEDTETYKKGLDILVQARCFLKHSYIASLGLRNDQAALEKHERQHSCLEMFTERLSQLTELNLHRLYLEHGGKGMKEHFQRLAFFATSVSKYQERMSTLRR
jgi:ariadne-1